MSRKRVYADRETCELRVTIPTDARDKLRLIAGNVGLEAAVYLRTLLITHLNKTKAPEASS